MKKPHATQPILLKKHPYAACSGGAARVRGRGGAQSLMVVVAQQAGGDRRLDDGAVAERVVRAPTGQGKARSAAPSRHPTRSTTICHRLQGKVRAVRTYSAGENLEAVPQRAGKYGLKVWHSAWLNNNEKENLEQINLLIDHANKYKDTVERVIVGNEVLLRKDLTANELRRYNPPGQAARVAAGDLRRRLGVLAAQPVAGRRGRFHHHPYPCPTGRTSRSGSIAARADGTPSIEKHIVDIYKKVQARFPRQDDRDRRDRLAERRPDALRCAAGPRRAGALLLRPSAPSAEREKFDYNVVEGLRPILEGAPGRHRRRGLGPFGRTTS